MAYFNIPLDISSLRIVEQTVDQQGNYMLTVESTKMQSKCHKCGKSATKRYGYAPPIIIRHLPVLDTAVFLKIKPVRYQCEYCGDKVVTTEQYDWCERNSKTTNALDEYLTRCMINSTCSDVARKESISYKTVIKSVNVQVSKTVDWSKYTDLETLGIDEISDKKGYQDFLTIVSTKSTNGDLSVIAVLPDRKKETIKSFLESIPIELKKTVRSVCTDMYDGFVYAATEVFGQQAVVIDRYHVAKLYRKPLDMVRIKEMKRLKKELSNEEYAKLEGIMWILRKNHECLTVHDRETLKLLYKYSPTLKKAHSYALRLTQIFNSHCSRKVAHSKLKRWITSVEKSTLNCFNSFITALNKYHTGIANYFKRRNSSGFVEGLNNKIKVIKRRCYGFFKTESLFQRLFLDMLGYKEFCSTN